MVPPPLVRKFAAEPEGPKESNDEVPAKKDRMEELRDLTDTECIITAPRVKGFDLKAKEWCMHSEGRN